MALSPYLAALRTAEAEGRFATISVSFRRVEHRRAQAPEPAAETNPLAPPQPASLALPGGWAKQDFGYLAATDTTTWLDWKKQGAKWVPRVFLWQMKADTPYMGRTSLQDAVRSALRSLRAESAAIYASKAMQVCGGRRAGWFLSYVKPADDPPLHFDEALYMSGDMIYRATYIRAADQPEDVKTRDSLSTLCSP